MSRYLIDHAIKNVWCSPDQDNQLIFNIYKISKPFGVLNTGKVMGRDIDLPVHGKSFHLYQVGQLNPAIAGLLSSVPDWAIEKWTKLTDATNTTALYSNVYIGSGASIPRVNVYYMFTKERNLIFAIQLESKTGIDYETEKVYVRLYTNAYYESIRSKAGSEYLYSNGRVVTSLNDTLALQSEVAAYESLAGHTTVYCNGYVIAGISTAVVKVGDIVEYIYDSSVKRVIEFTVKDLPTFTSKLDSKYKYLLHHLSGGNDTIDYQDDIDINILYSNKLGQMKGYYFHRNKPDSHRMVTHRDYSIPVMYFDYVADELESAIGEGPLDRLEFKVQLVVRDAGYYRPLIYDNNRIFELYKLPDEKVLAAMVGLDSSLDIWKAENLENSAYCRIMRDKYLDVTIDEIQKGYGYNGMSKVVGDTPLKTTLKNSRQWVELPYAQFENITVYEHNSAGELLSVVPQTSGTDYYATNNDTRLVEILLGKGTYRPDVRFGTDNIPLPVIDNYRVYMCYLVNDAPDNNWKDITGGSLYSVVNNTLVWGNEAYGQYLMVRTDYSFLDYEIDLLPIAGTLYFTFAEEEDRGDGFKEHVLPVPLGELDIWLNGKSLIRGLDYIVNFPMVYIVNKKHLSQPANSTVQKIHVRFTGFCNKDLSMDKIDDFGFVEHGFLSNNNRYDIRDDKVLRITLNGSAKHRSDVQFSEEHSGVSIVNALNGQPYQIKDIVVPLKKLSDENTYSLRDKSMAIDAAVSDYMTIKLPQPPREAVSSIMERYPLVSPFFSHLINDMASGQFNSEDVYKNLTDNEVIELCKPYEHLLAFDPISEANKVEDRFVIIYPHNLDKTIDLDIYQYRFVLRVVKLYGNSRIELSPFVTFTVP